MGDEGLPQITRREALRRGTGAAVVVLAAGPLSRMGDVALAIEPGAPGYLTPKQLSTLRGLVDIFVPGPPLDTVGGAVAGGCADAIDALLAAFEVDPPKIYAGAPFSDRAGSDVNHFERFLRLDRYEERAWKLRIRGSRGKSELEFNGPVRGWQQIYSEGLDALERAAGILDFETLLLPARELVMTTAEDPVVGELVNIAVPHTLGFMYGAPEYGGNRNLLGWDYTNFDGDVQPRGWTREEIEAPGSLARRSASAASLEDLLGDLLDGTGTPVGSVLALAGIGSQDAASGIVARSGDSLEAIRREVTPILEWARKGGLGS